jgi:hypothetical protein
MAPVERVALVKDRRRSVVRVGSDREAELRADGFVPEGEAPLGAPEPTGRAEEEPFPGCEPEVGECAENVGEADPPARSGEPGW